MIKILHIHTDAKFLHDTLKYVNDRIDNSVVYIGENDISIDDKLKNLGFQGLILQKINAVEIILKLINDYDIVVLNDFCKIKKEIVAKSVGSVKFYLRLFGYELYGLNLYKYLHKSTIKHAFPIDYNQLSFVNYTKKTIKRFLKLDLIKDRTAINSDLSKLSGIILVSQEEYNELNKQFHLPRFVQLPLPDRERNIIKSDVKNSTIIFGNSRHYWNNHLEILNSVRFDNTKVYMFFNYGGSNKYTNEVEKLTSKLSNIYIEENFLSFAEFQNIYSTASAIVINSYRQHALGNIITAIFSGCKIYLNPKSSTYKWLLRHGFEISSVYNLETDIKNNSYQLEDAQIEHNIKMYFNIKESYGVNDFTSNLISKVNE